MGDGLPIVIAGAHSSSARRDLRIFQLFSVLLPRMLAVSGQMTGQPQVPSAPLFTLELQVLVPLIHRQTCGAPTTA